MKKLRVLIADDHAILRDGLAVLINGEPDMVVVAQAVDGLEAVEKCQQTGPDVVLMDLSMPNCGGVEAIRYIRTTCPSTRVLALTMYDDAAYVRSVLAAGGSGYVTKRAAGTQVVAGIREVGRGRSFVSVSLGDELFRDVIHGQRPCSAEPGPQLSPREGEVLGLVAAGFTHAEIAGKLGISKKTVDTYRERLATKLGLKGRADIVRYALETGALVPCSPKPGKP